MSEQEYVYTLHGNSSGSWFSEKGGKGQVTEERDHDVCKENELAQCRKVRRVARNSMGEAG